MHRSSNIGSVLEAPHNYMYAGLGPGQPQAYIILRPFTSNYPHLEVTITIHHSKRCKRVINPMAGGRLPQERIPRVYLRSYLDYADSRDPHVTSPLINVD